jgi:uncharacterized protein YdeI (YjbR/CyaY-like superfamily)
MTRSTKGPEIDEVSYANRITPRRKGSNWSALNIDRVASLEAVGRMTDAGRRAFEARDAAKSRVYSYERAAATLDDKAKVPPPTPPSRERP